MTTTDQFDFGAHLRELEDITAWFEAEEVDLNEALVKFERGMAVAALLKEHLQVIENRVEKIKQKFDAQPAAELADEPEPSSEPALDLFTDK